MARRTRVVLQDDIDGTEPARTVTFSVEGRTYEIDLSDAHRSEFEAAVAPWIAHARRVPRGASFPEPRAGVPEHETDAAEIRRWAQAEGIPVRVRGRLPEDLRARYEQAHQPTSA
jgi:hypothetical protein